MQFKNNFYITIFLIFLIILSFSFLIFTNKNTNKKTTDVTITNSSKPTKPAFIPTDFTPQQSPVFEVKTEEPAEAVKLDTVVLDANGKKTNAHVEVKGTGEEKQIIVSPTNSFIPGKYTVETTLDNGQKFEQDFTWGVLAINPNKPVYLPNETAKLALAVLDEKGMMVCDAKLTLTITTPSGEIVILSTSDGTIKVNPECKIKDITYNPDYEASLTPKIVGKYQMALEAVTKNGNYKILDFFQVSSTITFSIERQTATRIFPAKVYPVLITVTANHDFEGEIYEYVPDSFNITQTTVDTPHTSIDTKDGLKRLVWKVNLKNGQSINLGYNYKAPDISPQFYLLGPLALTNNQNQNVYTEPRYWQIASDAITFVGDVATATSKTSSSTLVLTVGAGGVTAGNRVIVAVSYDSFCYLDRGIPISIYALSVTETGGNSYSKNFEVNNESGVVYSDCAPSTTTMGTAIFSANSAGLSSGDTITITFSGAITAKAATAIEFSNIEGYFDKAALGGNTGTSVATETVTTTLADELLFSAVGVEGPSGDTFTAGTDYITNPPTRAGTSGGSGPTNITVNPEYRIVSSINTYSATATLGTSRNWVAGIVTYKMAPEPPPPAVSTQFNGVQLEGVRIN